MAKRVLLISAVVLLVVAAAAPTARAEPTPTPDDVWGKLGVNPNGAPSLDNLTDKIIAGLVSAVRTLSVLSIPIAVCGAVIGALVWGIGAVSHNERVQKSGVVTVLSMCALPIIAKLAPVLVAAFARSF